MDIDFGECIFVGKDDSNGYKKHCHFYTSICFLCTATAVLFIYMEKIMIVAVGIFLLMYVGMLVYLEVMQTMRNLAKNMAWMLKCFEIGRQNGINLPDTMIENRTHFIDNCQRTYVFRESIFRIEQLSNF